MSIFSSDKSSEESGHLNVIATIVAKAGHEAEVRTALAALVPLTRAEAGCKGYHLLVDKKDPARFFTYEEWDSQASLDAHLEGVQPLIAKMGAVLAEAPRITPLEHLV